MVNFVMTRNTTFEISNEVSHLQKTVEILSTQQDEFLSTEHIQKISTQMEKQALPAPETLPCL